jgi:hypothetical protein
MCPQDTINKRAKNSVWTSEALLQQIVAELLFANLFLDLVYYARLIRRNIRRRRATSSPPTSKNRKEKREREGEGESVAWRRWLPSEYLLQHCRGSRALETTSTRANSSAGFTLSSSPPLIHLLSSTSVRLIMQYLPRWLMMMYRERNSSQTLPSPLRDS